MFCGSFRNQEDDHIMESMSPCSSPKRSKRNNSSYKTRNRFSDRGLDKFNALLSEVDQRKQRIYTQKGAEEISLVRFVISDGNQIQPVVVKIKEKRHSIDSNNSNPEMKKNKSFKNEKELEVEQKQSIKELDIEQKQSIKQSCQNSIDLEKLKHPWVYMPVIVIFILMFLVFYGRSFAIICTSIGWYSMPTILGGRSLNNSVNTSSRNSKKKKEYTKKLSEKGINVNGGGSSSPTSVIGGPRDLLSSPKHGHQRSW